MPQTQAVSISIKSLSQAVNSAVQTALKKQNLPNVKPEPGVVVVPGWLIGFILREAALKDLGQVQGLATDVAGQLQGASGQIHAAGAAGQHFEPAAYLHGGHIILGYRPSPEAIPSLKE